MVYLFLIDRVQLKPGATALCALELAYSLAESGDEVHVLTLAATESDYKTNDVFFHCLKSPSYKSLYGETPLGFFRRTWMQLCKSFYYGFSLLGLYDFAMLYNSNKTVMAALGLIERFDVETLVSFSEPFGTQLVGSEVKKAKSSIQWVACEMDPFALNYNRPSRKELHNRQLEERTLKNADLIIMVEGINAENIKREHLIEMQHKITEIPLPGFKFDPKVCSSASNSSHFNGSALNLVYTGFFYPHFRTPEALCKLLSKVSFDYELNLYGSIDPKYFKDYPSVLSKCHFLGHRPKEECDRACQDADVLIDIQNDIPNQIPSKLLSYMSYGKKIISFFSNINTLGIERLKHYPNALCIVKDHADDQKTVDDVDAFCCSSTALIDMAELEESLRPYGHDAVVDRFKDAVSRI